MFRYALRRLLWSIPALLATSFVLFVVTTLAPGPPAPARWEGPEAREAFEQAQRARFLDLPSFVNTAPADVRSRAQSALAVKQDLVGRVHPGGSSLRSTKEVAEIR